MNDSYAGHTALASGEEHAKLCPSHATRMDESWHIYE